MGYVPHYFIFLLLQIVFMFEISLILHYVFPPPTSPAMVFSGIGAYFGAQCEKQGMLVRVAGDNIMMSPPFIMTPEEIDEVLLLLAFVKH